MTKTKKKGMKRRKRIWTTNRQIKESFWRRNGGNLDKKKNGLKGKNKKENEKQDEPESLKKWKRK